MSAAKQTLTFEGTVYVCAHRVAFWYDLTDHPRLELTEELKDVLTEGAEERAKECIIDGCGSGELNTLFVDHENDGQDYEIRGWWEIEREAVA